MKAIYEPKGRAGEYAALAVNLYNGCGHGCLYCYAPGIKRKPREQFHVSPEPREGILEQLEKDAAIMEKAGKQGPVMFCFSCDAYQPIDGEYALTRAAILILHAHNIGVSILTKGGWRARRDFDLLGKHPLDEFGVTLTLNGQGESRHWEPNAAPSGERVATLFSAHRKGIRTWVSLEPVIYPQHTLDLVRAVHPFVDMFKVGKMNHYELAHPVDWRQFAHDVSNLLHAVQAKYVLKDDLRKYLR